MKNILKNVLRTIYPYGIPVLLNRGEVASILNARTLTGEGAEVGVKCGQFSEYLLDHWKGRRLYAIDPWREFAREVYHDADNVNQQEQELNYGITTRRLARFGERAVVLRMTSEEAAQTILDGSLDFAYLDARQDYESEKEDIGLWYPKIRPGGILCGHDYLDGEMNGTRFGVKRAVDEFAQAQGLPVKVTLREPVYKSWLVVKPGV